MLVNKYISSGIQLKDANQEKKDLLDSKITPKGIEYIIKHYSIKGTKTSQWINITLTVIITIATVVNVYIAFRQMRASENSIKAQTK